MLYIVQFAKKNNIRNWVNPICFVLRTHFLLQKLLSFASNSLKSWLRIFVWITFNQFTFQNIDDVAMGYVSLIRRFCQHTNKVVRFHEKWQFKRWSGRIPTVNHPGVGIFSANLFWSVWRALKEYRLVYPCSLAPWAFNVLVQQHSW